MSKRNVDLIKDLKKELDAAKYELGRYIQKIAVQVKEIEGLKKSVRDAEWGLKELNKAVEAVCISVALQCGNETEDGTKQIIMPAVDFLDNLEKYRVNTVRLDELNQYVMTVHKREEEPDDGNGKRDCK